MINPKIEVLKDRSFLKFNLKCLLKNLSEFRKGYLSISIIQNISIINCKIVYSYIREYLNVYSVSMHFF